MSFQWSILIEDVLDPQVLRELPADEVADTVIAVSRSGRFVFTGSSTGTIRAMKYPLPNQNEWIMHQAHCGPVTKVGPNVDAYYALVTDEVTMWHFEIIDISCC